MRIERMNNAVRNIAFGFIYRIVSILFPFAVRTLILYYLGSSYLGLNSLFSSILSFLSLAELGIGSALVYSMYKPIAEDDHDAICALLNLYKRMYRFIGISILAIGLSIVPFLKVLVKGECPADINMYVLYGIYLFNTVISYLMFGYKQSLLVAHQRNDIISKRSIVLQAAMYILQIVILKMYRNYYLYIILLPISTAITNVANSIIVDRMYPQYKCHGEVPKVVKDSVKKNTIALFGTKANSVVMHSADNIVISAFLGLSVVGFYGNYYYIMNSVIGIMTVIYESLTAGLGNSLQTESVEKNFGDFKVLTFLNMWITVICSTCFLCLYQSFMEIWVKHQGMLSFGIVILMVVYFYLYQIRRIVLTYKDAAGVWWADKWRPYVMLAINLVGNVTLVQIIGLYGVVLSTILAMLVSFPWETYTVYRFVFKRTSSQYYIHILVYTLIAILCGVCSYSICLLLPSGIAGLIMKAVVCLIVSNMIFCTVYWRKNEMKLGMQKIMAIIHKRR